MSVRPVAKRTLSRTLRMRDLLRREARALQVVDLPLRERLDLWRRGFTSESGALYDLSGPQGDLYVSDLAYYLRAPLINGVSNPTLNDKVIFFHTMRSLGVPTAAIHGFVSEHAIAWFEPPPDGDDPLLALLERDGELVLKPAGGGRGDRIMFVALEGGRLLVNREERDEAHLRGLLTPGTIISERLHQGAWAADVFPDATNTLRLNTMWDLERGEPFVSKAIHRFGTRSSMPVDNVSRGALMAPVDVESGELGVGVSTPYAGALAHHTHHPETGKPIEGRVVPGWAQLRDEVLEVNRRLAHIPYIGWDVLLGDDGWWMIEGNHYPDPTIQVFGPYLADQRVRRFFKHHGVVRRG